MAFVASAHGRHDTCIQNGDAGPTQQLTVGNPGVDHAQRHADEVAAVLHAPFHAACDVGGTAKAFGINAFDAHQGGVGRHARQRACRAVAKHRTSAVRAVALVVHRVIVAIYDVVAVVRKFLASIPKVVGQIKMVIIDTRIDDGHDDTFARVTQFPDLVGVHLKDVGGGLPQCGGRCGGLRLRNQVFFMVKANQFNVIALRKVEDNGFRGGKVQRIGRPKGSRLRDQAFLLHLGQTLPQITL